MGAILISPIGSPEEEPPDPTRVFNATFVKRSGSRWTSDKPVNLQIRGMRGERLASHPEEIRMASRPARFVQSPDS